MTATVPGAAGATMRRISGGRWLKFQKRVVPFVWFAFLASFTVGALQAGAMQREPLVAIVPFTMAVLGYVVFRAVLWDLADDVFDGGDFLLVQMRGEEERIGIGDIINVSTSLLLNPPRITLRLARPCRFGDEIAFSPSRGFTLNPFARSPVAEDLIRRVDAARRR